MIEVKEELPGRVHPDDWLKGNLSQLRKDVRFLTTLLGNMIREREGQIFFDKIEKIRALSKQIRQASKSEKILELKKIIDELKPDEAMKMARVFSIYFQLVNLAEELQRTRRILSYRKSPTNTQSGSIRRLFKDLKHENVSPRKIEKFFEEAQVELVLTAHPTEVKRRTTLEQNLSIFNLMASRDDLSLFGPFADEVESKIREILEIQWDTKPIRLREVKVTDEVSATLFFFNKTILDLIPDLYIRLRNEFRFYFDDDKYEPSPFLKFGSWVGGDRDGNPNVTCDVSRHTAYLHRDLILRSYVSDIESLIRHLSQSQILVRSSRRLEESIKKDAKALPLVAKNLEEYEPGEIYRAKLSYMHARLKRTLSNNPCEYTCPEEFLEDIKLIRRGLLKHQSRHVVANTIDRLIYKVRVFGFHLASLDFRDESPKIRLLLKEHFGDASDMRDLILKEISGQAARKPFSDKYSEQSREIIDQFETIRFLQEHVDKKIAGNYLLSMTDTTEDILGLFWIAVRTGLIEIKKGKITRSDISLIPLFETIPSLSASTKIMDELFNIPIYKEYLKSRGNYQEIMLGYSDSNKDGGYVAANWRLYQAQKTLAKLAQRNKVRLCFFHGKGGTIDRGGGQSHRTLLDQPFAAQHGQMRVTEQGEEVAHKYSNRLIASRNLEQLIYGVALNNLGSKAIAPKEERLKDWENCLEALSKRSEEHYRELTTGTEGFSEFLFEVTPVRLLEKAKITSRPSSRGSKPKNVTSLRAISWVFSWLQSRFGISSWYGLGTALEYGKEKYGIEALTKMYQEWPYFRSLIDNAQISLLKSDMYIAEEYSRLASNEDLGIRIMEIIRGEYRRTVRAILEITGQNNLLTHQPILRESIRLRNPYVDPLNFIQLRFLREWKRKGKRSSEAEKKIIDTLLLASNGISFGLKSMA